MQYDILQLIRVLIYLHYVENDTLKKERERKENDTLGLIFNSEATSKTIIGSHSYSILSRYINSVTP